MNLPISGYDDFDLLYAESFDKKWFLPEWIDTVDQSSFGIFVVGNISRHSNDGVCRGIVVIRFTTTLVSLLNVKLE